MGENVRDELNKGDNLTINALPLGPMTANSSPERAKPLTLFKMSFLSTFTQTSRNTSSILTVTDHSLLQISGSTTMKLKNGPKRVNTLKEILKIHNYIKIKYRHVH